MAMMGPILFVITFGLLLAYAAWQRHKRPYLFAEELEAALNEMAQHFRGLQLQIGRALLPAVKKAAEAMADFGRAFQGSGD